MGFRQNPDEFVASQRVQLYADGKPPLQLRDQVRRLGCAEGSGRDEQDMIGADHAVAGVDRRPFDNGQEIPLHPLPRDVRTMRPVPAHNLVDLVEKYNSRLLDPFDGGFCDLVHIDEPLRLFIGQNLQGLRHFYAPFFLFLGEKISQHIFDIQPHVLHSGGGKNFDHRTASDFGCLDLDKTGVQTTLAKEAAELVAGRVLLRRVFRHRSRPVPVGDHVGHLFFHRLRRKENIQKPVFREFRGL